MRIEMCADFCSNFRTLYLMTNRTLGTSSVSMRHLFILCLHFLILVSPVRSETCTKLGPCKCKTSKGTIDLTPLSGNGQVAKFTFTDTGSKDVYSFSPCVAFSQFAGCADAAMCQLHGGGYYLLGKQDSMEFLGDPQAGSLVMHFLPQALRESRITLHCSPGKEGEFIFIKEDQDPSTKLSTFQFSLTTKYACLPEHSLSLGSVLCIILLVLVIIYLVCGILFLKFVRGAQGAELIPNLDFWKDFPFLVRDGFYFVKNGCKEESTYEKI
ncbi:uncharacterized protein LOC106150578 [Lingula anatina]|uniref:Uncharacterized protein LOC106150578 n=1 Tax=Lingula anatina TaxID=7574 RepID=A0A1S3H195_LINAN|nr:uncharacterized protein LOC106150578 [Lingula anatina]|eukprot:XP_013378914.1 uncharacterized protein LOC106150578 [Lingula anatina]